jgi:hypothetical protein
MQINRSCSPEEALHLRSLFEARGVAEAATVEEAQARRAQGETVFVDLTKGGTECFPAAEMDEFRNTDCTLPGAFEAHQLRWGHES